MDLNAPLGMEPTPRHRPRRIVALISGLALAAIIGGGAYYLVQADPRGGEPYAVAVVPPAPPAQPPILPDPMPTGSIGSVSPSQSDTIRFEKGVKVVSPATAERSTAVDATPLVIDVTKALDAGGLKKLGSVDKAPRSSTNHSLSVGAPKPRVAIFIGGLGMSESSTRTALEIMPAAVTFAFVPYGGTVVASVETARTKGHEILLQLPMQSAKGTTFGDHTLRSGETSAEMAGDLAWLMSRFGGYGGVTNLLGASVTANPNAMTAILKSVAGRGNFYVDDGTSKRSLASSLGKSLGVPTLQTDVVLDATADAAVVRANLERLATIARAKGSAIGMASALSDHLAAIATFANQLDERGLTLVPVGAIAQSDGRLATSR